ncbi:hypothetical protein TSTA_009270 [Talaromyces stipitatus ATCC 10500]|uniref:Chromo domain-containing protein n=1 Tax=Talaromyces stipitatus (strain ATCC 10500 / CBS 375.48 / QM 6759 / NRRL 1006) TaxID=441959 RepID=B8MFT8_TALSN|nr:uncharacterized protein TSTA_009270 [Talaromyces stipitatus ATCC 10500]EED15805.1 hypothetical protein TSTA_009270 [Talaromyces stipitatus ATCC 10500]
MLFKRGDLVKLSSKNLWLKNKKFLEKYHTREDGKFMPLPNLEDDEEWEVEEIKDKMMINNQPHYLVKWTGWPAKYNQWVPKIDMGNAQETIR